MASPSPSPLPVGSPSLTSPTVVMAVVVGAHGVGGEVRLKLFTQAGAAGLKRHREFNDGAFFLESVRDGPKGAIARIRGVADRSAAEALRGVELWLPRAALPPLSAGEYYHADLIGLPVQSMCGARVGRVVAVENFGAGDLIEILPDVGAAFMVPLTVEAVPEWDMARLVLSDPFLPTR